MKEEDYKLIERALDERLERCHSYLDGITSTNELLEMKMSNLIELQKFARKEYAEMTKILMVDLYHIIGMGELTKEQTESFISKIEEYAHFRADLTNLSYNLDKISALPHLPTQTTFKLTTLCDLTLTSKVRADGDVYEIEDKCSIQDYANAIGELKAINEDEDFKVNTDIIEDLGFTVSTNKIIIKDDDESITKAASEILNCLFPNSNNKASFIKAITTNKKYIGFLWTKQDGLIIGNPISNSSVCYVEKLIKEKLA